MPIGAVRGISRIIYSCTETETNEAKDYTSTLSSHSQAVRYDS